MIIYIYIYNIHIKKKNHDLLLLKKGGRERHHAEWRATAADRYCARSREKTKGELNSWINAKKKKIQLNKCIYLHLFNFK
jgi:hypothetical protein